MDISYLSSDDQRAIRAMIREIDDVAARTAAEDEIEVAVQEWAETDPDGRSDRAAAELDSEIQTILRRHGHPAP